MLNIQHTILAIAAWNSWWSSGSNTTTAAQTATDNSYVTNCVPTTVSTKSRGSTGRAFVVSIALNVRDRWASMDDTTAGDTKTAMVCFALQPPLKTFEALHLKTVFFNRSISYFSKRESPKLCLYSQRFCTSTGSELRVILWAFFKTSNYFAKAQY